MESDLQCRLEACITVHGLANGGAETYILDREELVQAKEKHDGGTRKQLPKRSWGEGISVLSYGYLLIGIGRGCRGNCYTYNLPQFQTQY